MYLLKMLPGGVPVRVLFLSDVDSGFVERVAQSWGALKPRLTEVASPTYEGATVVVSCKNRAEIQGLPESAPASVAFLQLHAGEQAQAAERLTVEVTLKMLEQLAGQSTLFHAAALGEEATSRGMILIGPSGRGKTTASRFLGRHFLYLSDETAVIDRDFRLHPYPKPLSVITEPGKPKVQLNPADEGMRALSPDDSSIELAHMVLLNRREGIATPYFERVSLADGLLAMVSETSGLEVSAAGLQNLGQLAKHCGGVLQVNYTEIADTLELFRALFAGIAEIHSADDGARGTEEIRPVHVHEGEAVADRYALIARKPYTTVIEVGERELLISERQLMEPSPLALDIWFRLAEPKPAEELKAELMADYGEIPEDQYRDFIQSLRTAGILQ